MINVFYYIDRQLVFVEKAASELDRARGRVFLPVACRIATRYDALLISCAKSVSFLAFVDVESPVLPFFFTGVSHFHPPSPSSPLKR